MPLYGFECEGCGPFEVRRGFDDAASATACPGCGAPGRRVYSAPGVTRTPAGTRWALGREERSAHEPDVLRAPAGRATRHRHAPAPPWVMGH